MAYYGLDDKIGPIRFYDSPDRYERLIGKPYSENMAMLIDKEVQELVNMAYERTKDLLLEHSKKGKMFLTTLVKKHTEFRNRTETQRQIYCNLKKKFFRFLSRRM